MSKLIHYSGPAGSILLPQGYTRLAYIEGNANAWFSAGIAATANTKYKIKFSAKNKGSWNMIFGRWNNCVIGIYSSMHLYINGSDVGVIKEDEICDVTASSSAVYFKSKNSITCNKVSAHPVKLAVFGGTDDGDTNNTWGYGKGRIYELKIWEGTTLIRDYVPAKNSSGVAGLLDLVDNSWHPSSTSTQFKAGPEIPQGFPTSEYCQVEWLESTGTQYIQTDYYPTNNMQLQARACRMGDINDYQQLFGRRGGGATIGLYLRRRNDTNCAYDFNFRGSFSKSVFPNDTFVDIDINKNVCKVNGTQVASVTASTFTTTTYPFLLFAHSDKGRIADFLRGRISRIKITDGSIQHDYISCYRRSDMKPGMYDLISRTFLTNQGTGEFLLGPSITFGYGEIVNNVEAEAHPMLGTQYTETNKLTHTGNKIDDVRILPVYQRVEPGQQISISFDTDVTQWASDHGYEGGINKGKWSMWIYFSKVYDPNDWGWYLPVCYATSQIKSLGGTRWKYSFTVPADIHMIRVRTNLYSDGSTSYTAHFWNFNWSFGDTGCQVNPLHAIPHNISTGDGRNGEKNGAFDRGHIKTQGLESLKTSNWTIACWLYPLATSPIDSSALLGLGSTINGALVVESNRYFSYNTKDTPRIGNLSLENNKWTHIAFVNNGNTIKYYKNGIYVNEIDSTNIVDTGELWVGSRCFGGEVNCRFQDIQVWNEIKNPAELM